MMFIVCLLLSFSAIGCGDDNDKTDNGNANAQQENEDTTTSESDNPKPGSGCETSYFTAICTDDHKAINCNMHGRIVVEDCEASEDCIFSSENDFFTKKPLALCSMKCREGDPNLTKCEQDPHREDHQKVYSYSCKKRDNGYYYEKIGDSYCGPDYGDNCEYCP